jgi:DNA modification methylase
VLRVWCTPGLSERICYGIDIDCKYVDVAVQRWEKVSGKVAKLASNGQTLEETREEPHR